MKTESMRKPIICLLIILALISYGLTWHFLSVIPRDDTLILSIDHRGAELDKFFSKHKCKQHYTREFINAADRYKIDYRLLPAIRIKESGSKQCTDYILTSNNPFGWGSGRIGFTSIPDAIDYVTGQLANGHYYAGKTIKQKLKTYNSENPAYVPDALRLMDEMQLIKKYQIKI